MSTLTLAAAQRRLPSTRTAVVAGLVLAVSMTTIDQTIVALAAPVVQGSLHLTGTGLQWAVNAYLLAAAATFLLGGRIADAIGHARAARLGVVVFGVASALAGLAPAGALAEGWLVAARALQGVGTALMVPAAVGLLAAASAPQRRARTLASFFAVTGAMTSLGPIAGAYLTDWNWRAIFWVNVPIAIVAVALLGAAGRERRVAETSIDRRGAALVGAGVGVVVVALQQSSAWSLPLVATLGALGLALLAAAVRHLLRTERPLLDLRDLALPGFAPSLAAGLLASAALVSTFLFLSVYGQVSAGLTASRTGLLFLELFAGFVLGSRLGTRRYERLGARSVYVIGGLIGGAGFAWLAESVTHLDTVSLSTLAGPLALAGAGIGFVLTPAQADVLRAADRDHDAYGRIAAVTQTARYVGGALGIAGLGALVTAHLGATPDPRADYASAVQVVFLALTAVMLAVSVIGRRYPR